MSGGESVDSRPTVQHHPLPRHNCRPAKQPQKYTILSPLPTIVALYSSNMLTTLEERKKLDGLEDTTTPQRLQFIVKTGCNAFGVSAFWGCIHTRKSFSRRNTLNCLLLGLTRNKKGKERERKTLLGLCACYCVQRSMSMLGGKTVHLARELTRERGPPLCGNEKPQRPLSCYMCVYMCINNVQSW